MQGWSRAPLGARLPIVGLVGLLGLAAVVRPAAPFVFAGILFAYLATRRFRGRSDALAAVLPAAAILAWRSLPQPLAAASGADCTNLLAPPAAWRALEAAVALVVLAALVWDRRATFGELGFRRGTRPVLLLSVAALVVITPIALSFASSVGGDQLGGMLFGSYRLDLTQPLALAPALLFAGSNALAEELAYRGAMRTWLGPALGVTGANLAQAVVFGLSHTGEDFVGLQAVVPVAIAMIVVGFIGGVVARRTGSLTLLLAIHAAADIPIFYYWACRIG